MFSQRSVISAILMENYLIIGIRWPCLKRYFLSGQLKGKMYMVVGWCTGSVARTEECQSYLDRSDSLVFKT